MCGDELLNTLENEESKSYDSGIEVSSRHSGMNSDIAESTAIDQNVDIIQESIAENKSNSETSKAPQRKRKDESPRNEDVTISKEPTDTPDDSKTLNRKRPKHLKELIDNTESIENTILKWANEERRLINMKENLTTNAVDFGDYSILMYETQDAFNHCRNLRLKLQVSEEQLKLKTNQCNILMDQRKLLKKDIHQQKQESEAKIKSLQNRLNSTEQRLINVYGENEWLQGKYEEVKTLCVKYREKFLGSHQLLKVRDSIKSSDDKSETEDCEQNEGEPGEKTLLKEQGDIENELAEIEDVENYEGRPRRDTIVNPSVEEDMQKTIREITTMATKNDLALLSITKDCQKALEENSKHVNKIFTENQETADKLERWIDNYMILKRKLEEGTDIYKRELKKSWGAEKEYSEQIKALCETINKMTTELTEGKTKLTSYIVNFEKVRGHLGKMEAQIEVLHKESESRMNNNDTRLTNLKKKCEKLKEKQIESPSGRRRSSSSRRLSKSIFNLKRRLSENNEGAR